jgi:PIN domain nuclease of toxin-antitoxin system
VLLIDTQILVWTVTRDVRLPATISERLKSGDDVLVVSAVTAFEYADLNDRGRFGADLPLAPILDALEAQVIAFPADAWKQLLLLPELHRDPVDRMLVAHAIHDDLTLVTADETMRAYPVKLLW